MCPNHACGALVWTVGTAVCLRVVCPWYSPGSLRRLTGHILPRGCVFNSTAAFVWRMVFFCLRTHVMYSGQSVTPMLAGGRNVYFAGLGAVLYSFGLVVALVFIRMLPIGVRQSQGGPCGVCVWKRNKCDDDSLCLCASFPIHRIPAARCAIARAKRKHRSARTRDSQTLILFSGRATSARAADAQTC